MISMKISEFTNEQLISAYEKTGNVHKAGDLLGVRGASLHRRLHKVGYVMNGSGRPFTDSDCDRLMVEYDKYVKARKLDQLADEMGRTKNFICRQARKYGLTDAKRKKMLSLESRKKISDSMTAWIKKNGHPKGATGMVHTQEAREKISKASVESWAVKTEDEKAAKTMKMMKTRFKNGTYVSTCQKVSWKQGWRNIGGIDKYYRSRWEANYARYLEWLREIGEIKSWEHEPDVFWFEKIKRGCVSYLPDFKVTENNGKIVYHEVKGWMDKRSKTKLKRMAKYYPDVELILIDAKPYKSIERQMCRSIPGWEKA